MHETRSSNSLLPAAAAQPLPHASRQRRSRSARPSCSSSETSRAQLIRTGQSASIQSPKIVILQRRETQACQCRSVAAVQAVGSALVYFIVRGCSFSAEFVAHGSRSGQLPGLRQAWLLGRSVVSILAMRFAMRNSICTCPVIIHHRDRIVQPRTLCAAPVSGSVGHPVAPVQGGPANSGGSNGCLCRSQSCGEWLRPSLERADRTRLGYIAETAAG